MESKLQLRKNLWRWALLSSFCTLAILSPYLVSSSLCLEAQEASTEPTSPRPLPQDKEKTPRNIAETVSQADSGSFPSQALDNSLPGKPNSKDEAGRPRSRFQSESKREPVILEVPVLGSDEVEILSDKVYLYSYFNVLFKTPFGLNEGVQINLASNGNDKHVLRTEKLEYSRYQDPEGGEHRAFILGFYTTSTGLHQLPRLNFQSTTSGRNWISPALAFASFQVDEGKLPLPVAAEINPLPDQVYLGQNILLNIWATQVDAIDQSFLNENPEFTGFLIQKSPIKPNVERLHIIGKDVYRVSLGTWLLNPIEPGLLRIPAIPATVMGLQRQSLAHQLEVLPLPPNPYQQRLEQSKTTADKQIPEESLRSLVPAGKTSTGTAIGQFKVSFQLLSNQEQNIYRQTKHPQKAANRSIKNHKEYATGDLIHAALRITGHGNIHLANFPKLRIPSSLRQLQSNESEELKLDFDHAELYGWRQKILTFKAKNSGQCLIAVDSLPYFDPESGSWHKTLPQELTLQVLNLATPSYYANLEDLHFSDATVLFFNLMFWLQQYAFYICLTIFVLTSIYFLPQLPSLHFLKQSKKRQYIRKNIYVWPATTALQQNTRDIAHSLNKLPINHDLNAPRALLQRFKQRFLSLGRQYRSLLLVLLALLLFGSFYGISTVKNQKEQQKVHQHYLNILRQQVIRQAQQNEDIDPAQIEAQLGQPPYSVGKLPNMALLLYRNGLPIQALELAYLSYFYQPLQAVSRRLVSSLRIQQGLDPRLPDFFFWPLQLHHIWKYIAVGLFLSISLYCIFRTKQKTIESLDDDIPATKPSEFSRYHPPQDNWLRRRVLHTYRNYTIILILLLLSLSIPWHFSLAVNTRADLQLEPIPHRGRYTTLIGPNQGKQKSWKNRLNAGELVKIKGRSSRSHNETAGSSAKSETIYTLILGERQDQGWVREQDLFILPKN